MESPGTQCTEARMSGRGGRGWGGGVGESWGTSKKTMDFWTWLILRQISTPSFRLIYSTHASVHHPCIHHMPTLAGIMWPLALIIIHHSHLIWHGLSEHKGILTNVFIVWLNPCILQVKNLDLGEGRHLSRFPSDIRACIPAVPQESPCAS